MDVPANRLRGMFGAGAPVRLCTAAVRAGRLTHAAVRQTLDLYIEARLVQAAQRVACSRLHPVQARLARWLLSVYDRIDRDEFVVPQEIIAELVGVHRPTITVALQRIQDQGAIDRRGRAIIL